MGRIVNPNWANVVFTNPPKLPGAEAEGVKPIAAKLSFCIEVV
jgi:hypothetical protein